MKKTIILGMLIPFFFLSGCKVTETTTGWQRSFWTGEQVWVPPLGDSQGGITR